MPTHSEISSKTCSTENKPKPVMVISVLEGDEKRGQEEVLRWQKVFPEYQVVMSVVTDRNPKPKVSLEDFFDE